MSTRYDKIKQLIIDRVDPDEFIDVLGLDIEELVGYLEKPLKEHIEDFEEYLDV